RGGDGHGPAVACEPLEPADDDPQPGGVEEGDVGQVEGQPTTSVGDERLEGIAQHGGGGHIDLAGDVDDVHLPGFAGRDGDGHRPTVEHMTAPRPEADELLDLLTRGRDGRLRHVERIPARPATEVDLPDWVAPPLRQSLAGAGIDRLWSHQATAAQAARDGRHVVLSTGTASGKSLGYLLP